MKTKNINIQLAQDEYEDIVSHSQFLGFSISEFVLDSLRERLEHLDDVKDLKGREKNAPGTSWEDVQKELGLL